MNKIKPQKIKKDICEDCGKPFEPDQYYFWCNKCGFKREKSHFKRR